MVQRLVPGGRTLPVVVVTVVGDGGVAPRDDVRGLVADHVGVACQRDGTSGLP